MTFLDMQSTAWEEACHCAALLARGHIPREARCDWPRDVEVDGGFRRCYGWVRPDWDRAAEPGFLRTCAIAVICGMKEKPLVAPQRNGSTDDADMLAILVDGRWETAEEFLKLRFEADELYRARRFRRLAVAVYERLTEVEFLDQDDLRRIYEQETHAPQAA
jgi:hypothetical protein